MFLEGKVKGWLEKQKSWKEGQGSNEGDFAKLLNMNNGQLRSQDIVKTVSLCYNLQRLETLQHERDDLVRNSQKHEKIRKELEEQNDSSGLGIQEDEGDNRFSTVPKQV
jgi:uncharacterized protein with von Willebrand factor type A (vWA) domain